MHKMFKRTILIFSFIVNCQNLHMNSRFEKKKGEEERKKPFSYLCPLCQRLLDIVDRPMIRPKDDSKGQFVVLFLIQ